MNEDSRLPGPLDANHALIIDAVTEEEEEERRSEEGVNREEKEGGCATSSPTHPHLPTSREPFSIVLYKEGRGSRVRFLERKSEEK